LKVHNNGNGKKENKAKERGGDDSGNKQKKGQEVGRKGNI
jgi:hypothetical protein